MKHLISDGISVFFGLSGEGKSYVVTYKAIKEMLNPKSTKKVISNYPIIFDRPLSFKQKIKNLLNTKIKIVKDYPKSVRKKDLEKWRYRVKLEHPEIVTEVLSSYVWEDNFTSSSIQNSLILIDESHDRYTGSYAYELTKEDRKFFSRLRHNGNAVYLMSQAYDDIHPFILRRVSYLNAVKKIKFFWKKIPSYFIIETYNSIKLYNKRDDYKYHKKAKKTRSAKEKIPFIKLVSHAYNTHFFKDTRGEPKYTSWFDKIYNSNVVQEQEQPKGIEIKESSTNNTISPQDIKDVVSSLINLYGWKKKESSKIVTNYLNSHDVGNINELLTGILKDEGKKLD